MGIEKRRLEDGVLEAGRAQPSAFEHLEAEVGDETGAPLLDGLARPLVDEEALFARLQDATLSPASIAALGPLKDGLRTDLLPVDALSLCSVLAGLQQPDVKRIALEDSNLLKSTSIADQPVFVPASGSWRDVQDYVARELP